MSGVGTNGKLGVLLDEAVGAGEDGRVVEGTCELGVARAIGDKDAAWCGILGFEVCGVLLRREGVLIRMDVHVTEVLAFKHWRR
jgi:hypothetical protein